ncbi:acyltransferase [Verrucomicrobia bacterium]|nr:acyltransferase [Verrucomicrobiota bacterium]
MPNSVITKSASELKSTKNLILHGLYLGLYGLVKNLSFPYFSYLRYCVIRLFSKSFKATYISDGVTVLFPWKIDIASSASLNQGVIIDGFGGVKIGKGVRIAAYVVINTADHEFSEKEKYIMNQGYICSSVVIEDDVWIGAHVCINKGVTIGKGCIIGSGSVVTKDIPPYTVACGIPAKPIKNR